MGIPIPHTLVQTSKISVGSLSKIVAALYITAGYKGTDHTRESVPLLGYSKCWKQGVNIGTRDTYADIAATLAQIFEIEYHGDGTGFLEMLK